MEHPDLLLLNEPLLELRESDEGSVPSFEPDGPYLVRMIAEYASVEEGHLISIAERTVFGAVIVISLNKIADRFGSPVEQFSKTDDVRMAVEGSGQQVGARARRG